MVVPSTYEEISPVVIAEGFAYGMPVVGSAIGGIPDLIQPDNTGWLVQPASTNSWLQIFDMISRYPEAAKDMMVNCFRSARDYSCEYITGNYLDLY